MSNDVTNSEEKKLKNVEPTEQEDNEKTERMSEDQLPKQSPVDQYRESFYDALLQLDSAFKKDNRLAHNFKLSVAYKDLRDGLRVMEGAEKLEYRVDDMLKNNK